MSLSPGCSETRTFNKVTILLSYKEKLTICCPAPSFSAYPYCIFLHLISTFCIGPGPSFVLFHGSHQLNGSRNHSFTATSISLPCGSQLPPAPSPAPRLLRLRLLQLAFHGRFELKLLRLHRPKGGERKAKLVAFRGPSRSSLSRCEVRWAGGTGWR